MAKTGADDFLAAGGTADEMLAPAPDQRFYRIDGGWNYEVGSLRFAVRGLSESLSKGIHASLRIYRGGVTIGREGGLKIDSNLSITQFANRLKTQYPGIAGPTKDGNRWLDMLNYLCNAVLDAQETGDPVEWLDEGPALERLPYLISPLLPLNEPTMLIADSKAGKSYWALWVAMMATLGAPRLPFGWAGCKPTKTLILDWETNVQTFKYRLRRLSMGLELDQRPRIGYRRMVSPLRSEVPTIRRRIEEEGFQFVVVDSLGKACGAGGDDLKDPTAATVAMSAIRELGITALVIHHFNRDEANGHNGTPSRGIGSTYFRAYSRRIWEVRAANVPAGKELLLQDADGNDDAPAPPVKIAMRFEPDGGPVTISELREVSSDALQRHLPLEDQVTTGLSQGLNTVALLAKELGLSFDSVRQTLNAGKRKGKFVVLEGGGGRGNPSTWGLPR